MLNWTHVGTTALAAFLASLVEFVEALTIVLAVGISRSWRWALMGATTGVVVLSLAVLACWPLLKKNIFPLAWLQIAIGLLLLLFGLRWLRKAVLRAAGIIPLHDEEQIYKSQISALSQKGKANKFDILAFGASFKAVFIEGIEVVFIIIAVSAAETSLAPAGIGALAALLLVTLLGTVLHRPLTRIPENSLKFGVAIILSAFGIFWIGEGSGLRWPCGDWAIPYLTFFILASSFLIVGYLKKQVNFRINSYNRD